MTAVRLFTLAGSEETARCIRRLVLTLREFGGPLKDVPVHVYSPGELPASLAGLFGIVPARLDPAALPGYIFALKVACCARAEQDCGETVNTLAWLGPTCLVFKPPVLLELGLDSDVALRPVHHRNVGSLAGEPLDGFWSRVYDAVGLEDTVRTVESLVDGQVLRPWYNTHLFGINPRLGLLSRWQTLFNELARDEPFQTGPCADELHEVFLHQAVFSALVTKEVAEDRIRLLPPDYSYPLHFQDRMSEAIRAERLDDLCLPVYEDESDLANLPASDRLRNLLGR
jgi:hypothetical protein